MTLNLVNHLWQSTAVALAVLVLLLVIRGIPARTRRTLCWLALAKFAIPLTLVAPFLLPLGPLGRWLSLESLVPKTVATNQPSQGARRITAEASVLEAPTATPKRPLSGTDWLLLAWAAGAVSVSGLSLFRTLSLRRQILASASPLPAALDRQLGAAATRLGLKNAPIGLAVADDYAPAVVGFLSPIVVLPRGLERHLAPVEIQSVLLHELVHVQRRDSLLAAVQAFAIGALWFNPVVWLLLRQMQLESEKSCDERVLELTSDPDAYAAGILKCVRLSLGISQPLLSVANPPVTDRIKAILDFGNRADRPILRRLAIGTAVALTSFGGLAGTFAASTPATLPATADGVPPLQEPPASIPASPGRDGATVFKGPITKPVLPVPMPAAQKDDPTAQTLTVDFPDTEIRTIIESVADLFDLDVTMPETLTGRTSIKLRAVTWQQIYSTILEPAGYTFGQKGNRVLIVRASQQATVPAPAPAPNLPKNASERLTVDFPETSTRVLIGSIADLFDLNVVIPWSLEGKSSIKVTNATWPQIFETVLKPVGYTYVIEGNIIKIVPEIPVQPRY